MLYLVISDVHANLEALEAVLGDAGEYDAVLCLGDLVGYGPNPNECVQRVRGLPNLTSLVGNHDLAALGELDLSDFNPYARDSAEWTMRNLESDARDFLLSLPRSGPVSGFYTAHASPRDPVWEYMEVEEQGPPNFRLFDEPICLVGHTHVPRVFLETTPSRSSVAVCHADDVLQLNDGIRKIINPGSVGQPRDGDPRAAYALLDTDSNRFEFRRVRYSFPVTQEKITRNGLPAVLARRLSHGM